MGVSILFNGRDLSDYDYVWIKHTLAATAPYGYEVVNGRVPASVTETRTTANYPSLAQSDVLWVRVICDGTTLSVACVKNNTDYDNQGNCYSSTDFDFSGGGGILGIGRPNSLGTIDDFTVKTDRDANGSCETT